MLTSLNIFVDFIDQFALSARCLVYDFILDIFELVIQLFFRTVVWFFVFLDYLFFDVEQVDDYLIFELFIISFSIRRDRHDLHMGLWHRGFRIIYNLYILFGANFSGLGIQKTLFQVGQPNLLLLDELLSKFVEKIVCL
jgi:hypothetical protein